MEDFNEWLDDMIFEFDNDFLSVDKTKINEVLNDNQIDKI